MAASSKTVSSSDVAYCTLFLGAVQMAAKMANWDGRLFVGHFKTVKTVNQAMRVNDHRANAIGTFLDPGV